MKAAIQISISSTRLSKFEHPSQQGLQYINLRLGFYENHEVCLFVYSYFTHMFVCCCCCFYNNNKIIITFTPDRLRPPS